MIFRGIRRSDRPLSDPGEARTLDPLIKSQLLYQLSYGVIVLLLRCKGMGIFWNYQIFLSFFCDFLHFLCFLADFCPLGPVFLGFLPVFSVLLAHFLVLRFLATAFSALCFLTSHFFGPSFSLPGNFFRPGGNTCKWLGGGQQGGRRGARGCTGWRGKPPFCGILAARGCV